MEAKTELQTISCLLIQPNPDSALNATAGALIQEDYGSFARQAKLMASIHAPIPKDLQEAVKNAQLRGEENGVAVREDDDFRRLTTVRPAIAQLR